jgi:hypothetical protein
MSKEPRTYATAAAFRRALEERLKQTAQAEQVDINRLRRQVAFDRLLARLFQTSGNNSPRNESISGAKTSAAMPIPTSSHGCGKEL